MKFELPPLPYAKDALEPHIGAETLEFHYEKHHRGYLEKLRRAIEGKPEAEHELVEVIRRSVGPVYNNAAQVFNHGFYWQCMTPKGGGAPPRSVAEALRGGLGSFETFREHFLDCANSLFGSGYVWLYRNNGSGRIAVEAMKDADSPIVKEGTPLLCMDMWEHAYYLDYRNEKARYARAFLDHLVNWEFVEENLRSAD